MKAFAGRCARAGARATEARREPDAWSRSASGLQELPDALARELHAEIRLGRPSPRSARGPKGWTVGAAFQAAELYDGVIYAAPAHCIDEIDLGLAGGDRLKTLASIAHPPVAVLALGFRREDVTHPLDGVRLPGARGRAPPRARRHLLLHLFPGRAPDGHVLLTAFVGGVRNPDLANADLPTLTARVLDDLRAAARRAGGAHLPGLPALAQGDSRSTISAYGRFKEIMDEAERRNPGLALAGSYPRRGGAGRRDRRRGRDGADRVPSRTQARRDEPAPLRVGTRGSALALWQTEQVRARLSARRTSHGAGGDPHHGRPGAARSPRPGSAPARSSPARSTTRCWRAGSISRCTRSRICRPRCRTGSSSPPWPSGRIRVTRWWGAGRSPGATCPHGAMLATSSLRRRAQLLHVRPDLPWWTSAATWTPGWPSSTANADWTGILLAAAGLVRLGLDGPNRRAAAARGDAAGARAGRARGHRARRGRSGRRGGRARGPPSRRPRSPSPPSARSFARWRGMPGSGGGAARTVAG